MQLGQALDQGLRVVGVTRMAHRNDQRSRSSCLYQPPSIKLGSNVRKKSYVIFPTDLTQRPLHNLLQL
jgi:hypothetical protein